MKNEQNKQNSQSLKKKEDFDNNKPISKAEELKQRETLPGQPNGNDYDKPLDKVLNIAYINPPIEEGELATKAEKAKKGIAEGYEPTRKYRKNKD